MYPLGTYFLIRSSSHFLRKLVCSRSFLRPPLVLQSIQNNANSTLKHFLCFLQEIVLHRFTLPRFKITSENIVGTK